MKTRVFYGKCGERESGALRDQYPLEKILQHSGSGSRGEEKGRVDLDFGGRLNRMW